MTIDLKCLLSRESLRVDEGRGGEKKAKCVESTKAREDDGRPSSGDRNSNQRQDANMVNTHKHHFSRDRDSRSSQTRRCALTFVPTLTLLARFSRLFSAWICQKLASLTSQSLSLADTRIINPGCHAINGWALDGV